MHYLVRRRRSCLMHSLVVLGRYVRDQVLGAHQLDEERSSVAAVALAYSLSDDGARVAHSKWAVRP